MHDTLAALSAAIIENPADRTVRLVYADALDESGDAASTARAEFIRAQVELEAMTGHFPDDDPRRAVLAERCTELFAANWIDWWRPVCAAMGLPVPFVPGAGLGARLRRAVSRDRREPGHPYHAYPQAWSVTFNEYGFTAQFIAGFPELLGIHNYTLGTAIGPLGTWLAAGPFHRLRFNGPAGEFDWSLLDGPRVGKVTELTFDRLTPQTAGRVARCPLRGLTTLRVGPEHPAAEVVRALVCNPPWAGLRSFELLGTCAPDALRALAADCTLAGLDELSFAVSAVTPPSPIAGFVGGIGAMAMELLTRFTAPHPTPPGPITGPDYWPALEALAASALFQQLRRLRITDADPGWLARAAQAVFGTQVTEEEFAPFLSDACVRALADGLDADKLERLELPRSRLSAAARAGLAQRFGTRLALT